MVLFHADSFRDDGEVVRAAVAQNPRALAFASDRLREDLLPTVPPFLAARGCFGRIRGDGKKVTRYLVKGET